MKLDLQKLSSQTDVLLGAAKGLELKQAQLTEHGFELVFENGDRRVELRISPVVYTAGKVIVDAINDLTLVVEMKAFELHARGDGAYQVEKLSEERVELPYSTWFNESEYL